MLSMDCIGLFEGLKYDKGIDDSRGLENQALVLMVAWTSVISFAGNQVPRAGSSA